MEHKHPFILFMCLLMVSKTPNCEMGKFKLADPGSAYKQLSQFLKYKNWEILISNKLHIFLINTKSSL